jgi:hypothetical protein
MSFIKSIFDWILESKAQVDTIAVVSLLCYSQFDELSLPNDQTLSSMMKCMCTSSIIPLSSLEKLLTSILKCSRLKRLVTEEIIILLASRSAQILYLIYEVRTLPNCIGSTAKSSTARDTLVAICVQVFHFPCHFWYSAEYQK